MEFNGKRPGLPKLIHPTVRIRYENVNTSSILTLDTHVDRFVSLRLVHSCNFLDTHNRPYTCTYWLWTLNCPFTCSEWDHVSLNMFRKGHSAFMCLLHTTVHFYNCETVWLHIQFFNCTYMVLSLIGSLHIVLQTFEISLVILTITCRWSFQD